jgi:hypothetical protein
VICPNHKLCGAVTWDENDSDALDINVQMDEYMREHLNGNWRRMVAKVEDDHHRVKSLRKLNKNQRQKRMQARMRHSRNYEKKFPDIYYKFKAGCFPYAPSATAGMPLMSTSSFGLYNNILYMPENLTEERMQYLVGKKDIYLSTD